MLEDRENELRKLSIQNTSVEQRLKMRVQMLEDEQEENLRTIASLENYKMLYEELQQRHQTNSQDADVQQTETDALKEELEKLKQQFQKLKIEQVEDKKKIVEKEL